MSIKRILLLNYYWPPCGGPAVQRWINITKHFGDLGIKTYVLTVKTEEATFPILDYSLLEEIHPNVKTIRTETSELFDLYKKYIGKGKVPATSLVDEPNPNFLQKVARFARGNLFLPDPRRGWNKHAFKAAKELIEKEDIQLVITAGPPHSTHLVGLKLKKNLNCFWVADLHDYWTNVAYLSKFYRTYFAHLIDSYYEKKTIKNANLIMTHCKYSKDFLLLKVMGVGLPPLCLWIQLTLTC